MYYGWRARIGLVCPNTGFSYEYHKYAPEGVVYALASILFERVTPEGLAEMGDRVVEGAKLVVGADLDLIVFPCTTGSLIKGIGYDLELIDRIEQATGIQALTTTTAVITALKAVHAKRIVVATPYSSQVNEIEKKFLEDSGFEVLRIKGLGYEDPRCMGRVTFDQMYHLIKEIDVPEADSVFISCTGICVMDGISIIERDFSKPIITSNQATIWNILRTLSIREDLGLGKLFTL